MALQRLRVLLHSLDWKVHRTEPPSLLDRFYEIAHFALIRKLMLEPGKWVVATSCILTKLESFYSFSPSLCTFEPDWWSTRGKLAPFSRHNKEKTGFESERELRPCRLLIVSWRNAVLMIVYLESELPYPQFVADLVIWGFKKFSPISQLNGILANFPRKVFST